MDQNQEQNQEQKETQEQIIPKGSQTQTQKVTDTSVYSMDVPKEQILVTVKQLLKDSETMTEEQLYDKYELFRRKFFRTFITCIKSKKEDHNNIYSEISKMLTIREQMISKQKSSFEANSQISESLAERYLYPHTGKPSEEKMKALKEKYKNEK
jgi:hypothetical protein